jgi:alkylhydroperoxidase/carboxymuconolactone decarboxylase family protein YurZ
MGQVVRYQEILRRLAIIDDGFVEDPAGLGLGLAGSRVLDPKTAALVRVGALAAIGSPAVCLEWSTTRALAAGATEDEITDVLLAIAPVAGLGRVVCAVPGTAVSRSLIQFEDSEWPVHVPAGPAGGFGGVVASGLVQGADGEVPEGCHGSGS